jgi:hypothetical protein
MLGCTRWLEIGTWTQTDELVWRWRREGRVDEFAEGQLGRMRRKIRKRGQRLSHLEAQRRHRLRIKAKKLRYAAEFLAETFVAQADSGAWWRLSKRYKAPWVTFMISTSRLSWRCNRFAIGPPKRLCRGAGRGKPEGGRGPSRSCRIKGFRPFRDGQALLAARVAPVGPIMRRGLILSRKMPPARQRRGCNASNDNSASQREPRPDDK